MFVVFVFGALILGAGVMLAPALPTAQPRVGLAGVLVLGVVLLGACLWAFVASWDTLMVDYLVFGLLSALLIGGTLSFGQLRAESRGESLSDHDQGWTGPGDLLFFGVVTAALLLAYFGFPPAVQDSTPPGSVTALAPAFPALSAYLENALRQPPAVIQQGLGVVLGLLAVWALYDAGGELGDKTLGRAMMLAGLPGVLLLHGHYPALLGLVFAAGALAFALRCWRGGALLDALLAGVLLAALLLTDADGALLAGGVLVGASVVGLFTHHRPLSLAPLVGLLLALPYVQHLAATGVQPVFNGIGGAEVLLLAAGAGSAARRLWDGRRVAAARAN